MNKERDINKQIREQLLAFELQPRDASFVAVMEKLDKRKKRRLFFWLFFGAGFIMGSLMFVLNRTSTFSLDHSIANKDIHTQTRSKETLTSIETNTNSYKKEKGSGETIAGTKEEPAAEKYSRIKKGKAFSTSKALPASAAVHNGTTLFHQNSNANYTRNEPITDQIYTTAAPSVADSINGFAEKVNPVFANDQLTTPLKDSAAHDENFVFLDPKYLNLSRQPSPDSSLALITITSQPKLNPLLFRKRFSLLLGLGAAPQLGSYLFTRNKQHNAAYAYSTSSSNKADQEEGFSDLYLKNRRRQNTFTFNYAYSLKLGLMIDNTWELWLSIGKQRLQYDEKFYILTPGSSTATTPAPPLHVAFNTGPQLPAPGSAIHNTFNYRFYSIEVNRLLHSSRSFVLKLGAGLIISQLQMASYAYVNAANAYYYNWGTMPFASTTLYTVNLNCGLIKPLGKRLQLRASPGVFASPNSLFTKEYVIKQKSYGLQLELALVFRAFSW